MWRLYLRTPHYIVHHAEAKLALTDTWHTNAWEGAPRTTGLECGRSAGNNLVYLAAPAAWYEGRLISALVF